MTHHEEHVQVWQDILGKSGRAAVIEPNRQMAPAVQRQLDVVKDVDGALHLALGLEDVAADTYLRSLTEASSVEAARTAARIGIVEQQHQAFLLLAIGDYPAPDSLMRPEKAVTP